MASWYDAAVVQLREAFRDVPQGTDEKALRKIATGAWEWGPREHWPYKAWLRAVKDVVRQRIALEKWNADAPPAEGDETDG
jgi:hypothetical protein